MRIGFTTTVPVEAILAAGHVPVDLNNVFVADPARAELLDQAEDEGLPVATCAWIKGIYSAMRRGAADRLVVVLEGDCSNTRTLAELLTERGVDTIPFRFPYPRDGARLKAEIAALCTALGTDLEGAELQRRRLAPIRADLTRLDRACWDEQRIAISRVRELHLAASDFRGDPDALARDVAATLAAAMTEPSTVAPGGPRIGLLGVPTAFDDLGEQIATAGGHLVFDEMPRQFTLPFPAAQSLVEQYLAYTYPYDARHRLADVRREVRRRRLDGVVHYVQSFCHRQIEDVILRDSLPCPVLTLEGDRPGALDDRSRVRVQAFVEMLSRRDSLTSE